MRFRVAAQAIAKNENCYKGLLRKGKALGELGFFEKAEKVLEDLAKKNPEGPAACSSEQPMFSADITYLSHPGIDVSYINKELARLKAIDEHRERVNNEKMKG